MKHRIYCLLILCFGAIPGSAQSTSYSSESEPFVHRGYLGWITDLASEPRPRDAWPSIRIDDRLLRDYDDAFRAMREMGLNEVVIWGFFVSREWPVEVERAVDAPRRKQILRLIDAAHRRGLRVLSGMGVYSWGFEAIIRAHPELGRGNRQTMCLDVPESWQWQKRVIDYAFSFPIDGLSLQSADQGRCVCDTCPPLTDAEYHAAVNQKVVQYVRTAYPGKLIGISGWGMDLSRRESLPHYVAMTRNVDYFTAVQDGQAAQDTLLVRDLIAAIRPCTYGTTGTPNVEPPQHHARDRWFLPTARRAAENLRQLYRAGGRSAENYMHVLANPGDEATIRLMAKVEQEPATDWRPMYRSVLETMFRPRSNRTLDSLVTLFLRAEDAYFDNKKTPYRPGDLIRIEPLIGDRPGPLIYLTDDLSAVGRRRYFAQLRTVLALAGRLRAQVGDKAKLDVVIRCIRQVLAQER